MKLIQGLINLFRYIEPLWLGSNKQLSIKKVLAIWFSYDLMDNISYAIHHFEVGKSLADVAMLGGIEAGIIAGLLTLSTASSVNMFNKTVDNDKIETVNSE